MISRMRSAHSGAQLRVRPLDANLGAPFREPLFSVVDLEATQRPKLP